MVDTLTCIPIGAIRTPHPDPKGAPIQPTGARDAEGRVEVLEQYAQGLDDLDGFSHCFLLYRFHLNEGFSLKVKPFMDDAERGLFSTRAPRRPNPIGLSVVEIVRREGNALVVRGVDMVDGSPLLDIKPYVPTFDAPEATALGWMQGKSGRAETARADERFVDPD